MPDVLIEVRRGWMAVTKADFADAVYGALARSLQAPSAEKIVRIVEHAPENFALPDGAGERYTHIEIVMFAGRSIETKRTLYRDIVRAIEPFGVPAHDIKIVLLEIPKENVGFRAGVAASDVDIGYETGV